ncbi:MAG: glycosyltransferase family 4 protein [Candidatus Rokubacteria bacterium]|nr:glycosyltransferase family 4 protein [Candidatus Rokubacteria bacterium]
MRVAIVCRPFSFYGGLETATAGLVREFVHQGYDLHLFSPPGQLEIPGVTHHRLPVIPAPSAARHLSLALAASAAVRRVRVDVVQSHERSLFQHVYRAGEGCHRAYLAVKARRRRGAGRLALKANPAHLVLLALERRIFASNATRWIVAISRRGAQEIRQFYGVPDSRLTVIYNGVDQNRFHPAGRARFGPELRDRLGIPRGAWLVLMVGSGFERKGLGPLIEGFARLRDRDARLLVVGKGSSRPYRALGERLGVASRVIWAGPRPDIERFYAAADLVALPSLYEPFGNVHLEALASGLPVLASARSGGAEIIRHGEIGWILGDPEDPSAIADGLEALRDADPVAITARAREAVKPFTFTAQVQAFAELYRTL